MLLELQTCWPQSEMSNCNLNNMFSLYYQLQLFVPAYLQNCILMVYFLLCFNDDKQTKEPLTAYAVMITTYSELIVSLN